MAGEEFERKLAAILAADVLDTSADGRGRGRHARPAQGCALDIDRAQDRRAPRSDSQAHRRWCPGRVRKRCRRGAVRGRGPTKHRRAQRGHQTRVRFDTEGMAVTIDTFRLHRWQQIPIVELRTWTVVSRRSLCRRSHTFETRRRDVPSAPDRSCENRRGRPSRHYDRPGACHL